MKNGKTNPSFGRRAEGSIIPGLFSCLLFLLQPTHQEGRTRSGTEKASGFEPMKVNVVSIPLQ